MFRKLITANNCDSMGPGDLSHRSNYSFRRELGVENLITTQTYLNFSSSVKRSNEVSIFSKTPAPI